MPRIFRTLFEKKIPQNYRFLHMHQTELSIHCGLGLGRYGKSHSVIGDIIYNKNSDYLDTKFTTTRPISGWLLIQEFRDPSEKNLEKFSSRRWCNSIYTLLSNNRLSGQAILYNSLRGYTGDPGGHFTLTLNEEGKMHLLPQLFISGEKYKERPGQLL